MRSHILGTVLALSTMTACDGGGDDGLWTLRPNVSEVYSEPGPRTVTATVITDAERDGDRIVILRASLSSESFLIYPNISMSEDLGKTWRHVYVPKELRLDLLGDSFQLGVHTQDGRVFLVLSADAGNSFSVWRIYEVDMDTGDTTEIPVPLTRTGHYLERYHDGHLRWVTTPGPPYAVMDLDVATGTVTYEELPCSNNAACGVGMLFSPDRGDTWAGYTPPRPGLPVCSVKLDVAGVMTTEACVNRPVWPSPNLGTMAMIAWRGTTPYMLWSSTQDTATAQAYATALLPGSPAAVTETLQLGPGLIRPWQGASSLPRYRFGDFAFLEGVGVGGRLARLGDAGAERVQVPTTPCTVDDGCGFADPPTFGVGQIQWIMPLDVPDEYLVFYTMATDIDGGRTVYVARETASYAAVTDGEPPPVQTVDVPAGAQPMNELEQACAVWANCEFDTAILYKQCLDRWMTERAEYPGLVEARARFIAAATTCASLDAIEASSCPLDCTLSGGTCGTNYTGVCSTEVTHVPGNCNSCDGSGRYLLCSSSRSFTVTCANGTVCSSGSGCVLSGANACSTVQTGCDGDDILACSQFQNRTVAHCDLAGATCTTSNLGALSCVAPAGEGACTPGPTSSSCNDDATHVLHCAYGQLKYLACSDIGYTECVEQAYGAVCH